MEIRVVVLCYNNLRFLKCFKFINYYLKIKRCFLIFKNIRVLFLYELLIVCI